MNTFRKWHMIGTLLLLLAPVIGCGSGVTPGGDSRDPSSLSILSTYPEAGATDITIATTVTATCSGQMDSSTLTTDTFYLEETSSSTRVSGSVSYSGTTATFVPAGSLSTETGYTATMTTVAADVYGDTLSEDYSWSFTTGSSEDTRAPTVGSTNPSSGETGVFIDTAITATFSESMDETTIDTTTFIVNGVTGTVTYNSSSNTATFTPSSDLDVNTTYTCTISSDVEDASANALGADYTWSFTTGTGTSSTVSYASQVQPIFDTNCIVCHQPGGVADFLNLTSVVSYDNLVNQPSERTDYNDITGETNVIPYNSADSVLYRRISQGSLTDGEQVMPPPSAGGTLSAPDQGLIETWIDEGAQDN